MSQYKPTATGVSDGKKVADWDNIPTLDWVPRKPEPLGKELKTCCDGESGIFLRVLRSRRASCATLIRGGTQSGVIQ
jgi:hypothetical protein